MPHQSKSPSAPKPSAPKRRLHELAGYEGVGQPVAPAGWKWKCGKRATDMYFHSPQGQRFGSRRKLESFLSESAEGPKLSDFCWKVTRDILKIRAPSNPAGSSDVTTEPHQQVFLGAVKPGEELDSWRDSFAESLVGLWQEEFAWQAKCGYSTNSPPNCAPRETGFLNGAGEEPLNPCPAEVKSKSNIQEDILWQDSKLAAKADRLNDFLDPCQDDLVAWQVRSPREEYNEADYSAWLESFIDNYKQTVNNDSGPCDVNPQPVEFILPRSEIPVLETEKSLESERRSGKVLNDYHRHRELSVSKELHTNSDKVHDCSHGESGVDLNSASLCEELLRTSLKKQSHLENLPEPKGRASSSGRAYVDNLVKERTLIYQSILGYYSIRKFPGLEESLQHILSAHQRCRDGSDPFHIHPECASLEGTTALECCWLKQFGNICPNNHSILRSFRQMCTRVINLAAHNAHPRVKVHAFPDWVKEEFKEFVKSHPVAAVRSNETEVEEFAKSLGLKTSQVTKKLRRLRAKIKSSSKGNSVPHEVKAETAISTPEHSSHNPADDIDGLRGGLPVPISQDQGLKVIYTSHVCRDSVQLDLKTIRCLDADQWLDDTVIDFYILYLLNENDFPERVKRKFKFFNCFFYPGLVAEKSIQANAQPKTFGVVEWNKNDTTMFDTKYLIIPINICHHWSLAIVCNPRGTNTSGECSRYILHLDSLGDRNLHDTTDIGKLLKGFIRDSWKQQEQRTGLPPFDENNFSIMPIEVPLQQNGHDCGVFVLCYIERFMKNAPDNWNKDTTVGLFGRDWFHPNEATQLRRKIQQIIINLCARNVKFS